MTIASTAPMTRRVVSKGFMKKYKQSAWEKLPLRLIGPDGMRALLARIEEGK